MGTTVGAPVSEALKTTALVVLAVGAFSALFGWQMWRFGKHAERVENDPVYLRKSLRRGAYFYIGASVLGIATVVFGKQPKESLIGLPVALLLIWFFLHSAAKVKLPPK